MPIACVDVLVTNPQGQVLLLKRGNEPMQDRWWFPGGRVKFLESRSQAAARKLLEECGLTALDFNELGTYDVILEIKDQPLPSHAITTLFQATVETSGPLVLDYQSQDARWRKPEEWLSDALPDFVQQRLLAFEDCL